MPSFIALYACHITDAVVVCLVSCSQDPYGYTPVHFAAQRNHVQALQCLLAHGARPDGVTVSTSSVSSTHASASAPLIHPHPTSAASGGTAGGRGGRSSRCMLSSQPRVCKASPLHRAGEEA